VAIALREAYWPGAPTRRFLGRAEVDLSDLAAIAVAIRAYSPKVVINAAAYTAVDRAEEERALAQQINGAAPGAMAAAADAIGAWFAHLSTDYVFDGTKAGAYVESDPVAPVNAYGETKLAGEQAIQAATERHLIARTSWVYSATGNNFVKTMLRLAGDRDELRVVADQYGCPTSADEIATMLVAAATLALAGRPLTGLFHFAGDGVTSWHGLASTVISHASTRTGRYPLVHPITTADFPTSARRPSNAAMDSAAIVAALGLQRVGWAVRARAVVDR
jgi:dTDP-4-dehydrorhamnose reductase